jgi:hypothetical protein
VGAAYYFSGQHSEAIGLVFLATFLILVYLLWFTIALRWDLITAASAPFNLHSSQ